MVEPSAHDRCKEKVATINAKLNEWASAYATTKASPWQDLGDYGRWHFVKESMGAVATLVDGDVPQPLTNANGTKMILDALVANHVYFRIFASPFFSFPNHRLHGPGELDWIYGKVLEENKSFACEWRAHTLALFDHEELPKLSNLSSGMFERAAKDEVEAFLNSTVRCLLNNNRTSEYTEQLTKIFILAAETARNMWQKECFISCQTLGDSWDESIIVERGVTLASELRSGRAMLLIRPQMEIVQHPDGTAEWEGQIEKHIIVSQANLWLGSKEQ